MITEVGMFLRAPALLVGLVFASHSFSMPAHGQRQEPGVRCTRLHVRAKRQKPSTPNQSQTPQDLESLVRALRAQGVSVERAGEVSQPFFSVEGQALTADGENVQVFQFPSADVARREAGQVSPDGSSVGTSMMSWVGSPHFFKSEKMIALYVGDSPRLLEALRAALGAQFAGR